MIKAAANKSKRIFGDGSVAAATALTLPGFQRLLLFLGVNEGAQTIALEKAEPKGESANC